MNLRTLALLACTASIATICSAAPAHAEERDGLCETEEACLYYRSFDDSVADYVGDVEDFTGHTFIGPGAGQGEPIRDNVGAVRNLSATWSVALSAGPGQTGPVNWWPPNTAGHIPAGTAVGSLYWLR